MGFFLFLVYQRSCSLLCNSHSAMNDKWKVPERILIHSSDVIFGALNRNELSFYPTSCLLLDYAKGICIYLRTFLTSKSATILQGGAFIFSAFFFEKESV